VHSNPDHEKKESLRYLIVKVDELFPPLVYFMTTVKRTQILREKTKLKNPPRLLTKKGMPLLYLQGIQKQTIGFTRTLPHIFQL